MKEITACRNHEHQGYDINNQTLNQTLICQEWVKGRFDGHTPEKIRFKFYKKDPKKKNTFSLQLRKHQPNTVVHAFINGKFEQVIDSLYKLIYKEIGYYRVYVTIEEVN